MTWWLILINATVPLLLAELLDWFPWLAERVIRRAARMLPAEERDRYEHEWLADMESVPGRGFSKLLFALRVAISAPWTRAALRPEAPLLRHVAGKRLVDVALSALMLLTLAPLLVVIALGIQLDSRGPIFYRRRSRGLDGREIGLLRFRTSPTNDAGMVASTVAVPCEPINMRVGRVLQRTSLDELPQLFNILRGDLSLVGPRPGLPRIREARAAGEPVKPGLVSWTVLLDGSEEARRRDQDYARAWSLRKEITVLLRTIVAALRRRR